MVDDSLQPSGDLRSTKKVASTPKVITLESPRNLHNEQEQEFFSPLPSPQPSWQIEDLQKVAGSRQAIKSEPTQEPIPAPIQEPFPKSALIETVLTPLFEGMEFPPSAHQAYLKYQQVLNRMIAHGYSHEYQTTYMFAIRELSVELDQIFTKYLYHEPREGLVKASTSCKSSIFCIQQEYFPPGQDKPKSIIAAISKQIGYEKTYNSLRKNYKIDLKITDILTEILIQTILSTAPSSPPGLFPKIYSVYSHSPYVTQYPCVLQPENGPGYGATHEVFLYIDMEYLNMDTLDLYLKSALSLSQRAEQLGGPKQVTALRRHIRRDIVDIYIRIAEQLIELQERHELIHGDLKGSNILLNYRVKPALPASSEESASTSYPGIDLQSISLIDFEYSHIKVGDDHIFAQTLFSFDENYDRYNLADPSNIFEISENGFLHPAGRNPAAAAMGYDLDFAQSYAHPYRFRMDLLYLLLSTAHLGPCYNLFCHHFFVAQNGINLFRKIIANHLEYEAFVYSKDMNLLRKICEHHQVPFELFMEQFEPRMFIAKLERIKEILSKSI